MKNQDGFRLGVGMVLLNNEQKLFWAQRMDIPEAWQFPQGGIHVNETAIAAMYRELNEELGLNPSQVKLIAESKQWYEYHLPQDRRQIEGEKVIGQKQKWYLLRLKSKDSAIDLEKVPPVEFRAWQWVSYWYPLKNIVDFKKKVYRLVLTEFEKHLT